MMWDEVMTRVVAAIRDDSLLMETFEGNLRRGGAGEQQVPGIEWHLLGDTEGELWAPILIQFDLWTNTQEQATIGERRLRSMFHQDVPVMLDDIRLWMYYSDGQELATPERSGFNGRALRFRFTPLRRQYAFHNHVE
jgi:hypothetical protein